MSDGNYNRALLPKNELAAGLRAGKAQMRAKAETAFDAVMGRLSHVLKPEELVNMKKDFMDMLRK